MMVIAMAASVSVALTLKLGCPAVVGENTTMAFEQWTSITACKRKKPVSLKDLTGFGK